MKRVPELAGLIPRFPTWWEGSFFCIFLLPPGQDASGCEGTDCWAGVSAGEAKALGIWVWGKEESLGLRSALPGKSEPKCRRLFSFLPHQIFQGILDVERLAGAGCGIIVVSPPPLLRCLHADLSSLPQPSQPA